MPRRTIEQNAAVGLLTTGNLAAILSVSPPFIRQQSEKGAFVSSRIPGSKELRIDPVSALAWVKSHGFEYNPILDIAAARRMQIDAAIKAKLASTTTMIDELVTFNPEGLTGKLNKPKKAPEKTDDEKAADKLPDEFPDTPPTQLSASGSVVNSLVISSGEAGGSVAKNPTTPIAIDAEIMAMPEDEFVG